MRANDVTMSRIFPEAILVASRIGERYFHLNRHMHLLERTPTIAAEFANYMARREPKAKNLPLHRQ
jgi:hypothetical protein